MRLLLISIFLLIVIQYAVTDTVKIKPASIFKPQQQSTFIDDDDYSNDDNKNLNIEDSSSIANLDEYNDEDDDDDNDEDLIKLTSTTVSTTTKRSLSKLLDLKQKYDSTKKPTDAGDKEFDDDYNDLDDDVSYDETTTKGTTARLTTKSTTMVTHRQSSLRLFLTYLSRPPVAAGILAGKIFNHKISLLIKISFLGLSIGIIVSVVLLICIIKHFQNRERTHSSFTAGLLYPNQYGYMKTPQEFYA